MTQTTAADRILQIGLGFRAAKVLLTAVKLGVFTQLGDGAADLQTLSCILGLHDRAARDFLDALVALGLLEREDGFYRNSAEASTFLDDAKRGCIGGYLEMADAILYPAWGELGEAVTTGQSAPEDGNRDLFNTLYATPQGLSSFLRAMSALSADAAGAIARLFPWCNHRTFVDIGAAQGRLSATLAHAHPHLTGTGFDLPAVKPVFDAFIEAQGVADRVMFRSGNFFCEPLPCADVLIMGHILHDWDLAQKRALLAKAYEALPPGGALIVYEAMIDEDRRKNAAGLLSSLNMLVMTPGGFDFSGAECEGWMRRAGFAKTWTQTLTDTHAMTVGLK